MVHKKSTYRLTYRNYAPHVRKTVWEENNSIRLRRREEEWSHHSIEEDDSDCECDESEEDQAEGLASRGLGMGSLSGARGRLSDSQEQVQQQATLPSQPGGPHPHVPRLRFSPDQSPRIPDQQRTPDSADEGALKDNSEHHDGDGGSVADISDVHVTEGQAGESRRRPRSSSIQLGVMRPGSQAREYDLIPAAREEVDGMAGRAALAGNRVVKSRQVPLTSKLSRTTRRNYHNRDRITYVPYGTGSSVRHIGDKTSFNIHLNKTQVHPTALQASSFRNREIENLIRKQRNLTIDDWREKKDASQPVNHSSLWANGRQQIFSSRRQPREYAGKGRSRVEVFSNYCKHCGGRK